MKLQVNAVQAIEGRGRITISTGQEGETVWVAIGDDGKEMTPETVRRVLESFFTTKPLGEGSGLGRSVSYGIVGRHRGRIEVRSSLGEGCCFRVTLPIDGSAVDTLTTEA